MFKNSPWKIDNNLLLPEKKENRTFSFDEVMNLIGYTASDLIFTARVQIVKNGRVSKLRVGKGELKRPGDLVETKFGHIKRMFVPKYGYCYSMAFSKVVGESRISQIFLHLKRGADLFLHEPGIFTGSHSIVIGFMIHNSIFFLGWMFASSDCTDTSLQFKILYN